MTSLPSPIISQSPEKYVINPDFQAYLIKNYEQTTPLLQGSVTIVHLRKPGNLAKFQEEFKNQIASGQIYVSRLTTIYA